MESVASLLREIHFFSVTRLAPEDSADDYRKGQRPPQFLIIDRIAVKREREFFATSDLSRVASAWLSRVYFIHTCVYARTRWKTQVSLQLLYIAITAAHDCQWIETAINSINRSVQRRRRRGRVSPRLYGEYRTRGVASSSSSSSDSWGWSKYPRLIILSCLINARRHRGVITGASCYFARRRIKSRSIIGTRNWNRAHRSGRALYALSDPIYV